VRIAASTARATRAVFRYEGDRPIVVIGRVTGAKYAFARRGAEVAVDIRDRSSVVQVPRLREIRLL
jgi:nitroimidazol reductase NimA-like FMN-containing flavoprotein (pyridoxamine 5'-phosphate oxidase superfamily)